MSLDNIQLPPIILQDLYKNVLIDIDTINIPATTTKNNFSFLGDYKKQILILVDDENSLYLSDDILQFLMGILAACKLTIADIALINCNSINNTNFKDINDFFNPKIILFFGNLSNKINNIPLSLSNNQIEKNNTQYYLASPSLTILQHQIEEKKTLWLHLKQIFEIK